MVHNQTNTNRNDEVYHMLTPTTTVLLDNDAMVHNQMDINENGNDHLMC